MSLINVHPNGLFSGDYISALRGCCAQKFLHTLEIGKGLLAHPKGHDDKVVCALSNSAAVTNALQQVFIERKPEKLWVDKGKEFYNKDVRKLVYCVDKKDVTKAGLTSPTLDDTRQVRINYRIRNCETKA